MANLGIDLGTSTVIVSYYSKDAQSLNLVYPERNMALTTSCVYVNNDTELIGINALNMLENDPKRTFKNYKLYLGVEEYDKAEQLGFPMLPKQLTTIFLKKLKGKLNSELNESCPDFDKVIITVPHKWGLNSLERANTEQAAREAGFSNILIQSEPVMGAAFYCYEAKPTENQKILVCDFGAGTFDLTVCEINEALLEPIYNDAIPVAGDDIDDSIIYNVCKVTPESIGICQYNKLKYNFEEKIKKSLNDLKVGALRNNDYKDPKITLELTEDKKTYSFKYSDLKVYSKPILKKMGEKLEKIIREHGDIDCIVSIGGGSLFIPYRDYIEKLSKEHEKSTYFFKDFNSDKAISYGASLVANGVINIEEKIQNDWGILLSNEAGKEVPIILLPKGTPYNERPSILPGSATINSGSGGRIEIPVFQDTAAKILKGLKADNIPADTDFKIGMFVENGLLKIEVKYADTSETYELERIPTLSTPSFFNDKRYEDPEGIFL